MRASKAGSDSILKLMMSFPSQCREALELGRDVKPGAAGGRVASVICAGMGGSAIGADIVRSYTLSELSSPMYVARDYALPAFADGQTLLFVSSYSGNTEEAISAYRDGMGRKARIVVLTSGGRLRDMAVSDGVDLIELPQGLPPRCALGYSFIPMIRILTGFGLLPDKTDAIGEMITHLEGLRERIGPGSAPERNIARRTAERIGGMFPVIYSSCAYFDVVATRWRSQLAENSKQLSSRHVFPEAGHNEIAGWQYPPELLKRFIAVFLRDRGGHGRVGLKMDMAGRMLVKDGIDVVDLEATGEGLLSRMMSLIYIGDMVSFYLAQVNGVDPMAIGRIDRLKEELMKSKEGVD